ncbi:MAG: DUF2490 domain-containing protein [Nitrospinota bacterium]
MRIIIFLLAAGFIFTHEVRADEVDTQYWHETVFRKNFNENIGIFLKAEQWLFDDMKRLALYNFAPGILFRPSRFLDFELNYRYQTLRETTTRNHEHRIGIVPILKYEWGKFKFSLRNRLELRDIDGDHSLRLRERLKIKRKVELMGMDVALFASNEIFYNSNPDDFDQNRAKFGISKPIQPNLSMDIYYMYFRQERSNGWFTAHALGTFLSVTF